MISIGRMMTAAAVLAATLTLSAPASAVVTTLTFDGLICGTDGDAACGNGSQIGQNYGDGVGVNVSARSVVAATGATFESFLKYWATGYGDLVSVVWGGSLPDTHASELTFAALPGYELTVLGFDAACYLDRASCQSFPFTITEIGGAVAASGSNTATTGSHVSQTFALDYSTAGYVLSWGPDGYDGGLDNIRFDVRAVTDAVPESATWMLMIVGFGTIGSALRFSRPTAPVQRGA